MTRCRRICASGVSALAIATAAGAAWMAIVPAAYAANACGDGVCAADETCKNCRRDCGACAPAPKPAPAAPKPVTTAPKAQAQASAAGGIDLDDLQDRHAPTQLFGEHGTAEEIAREWSLYAIEWYNALTDWEKAGLIALSVIAVYVLWRWLKARRNPYR